MYERQLAKQLRSRITEGSRRFIQIVIGPRQVGKTTCVRQATDELGIPVVYASADTPGTQSPVWLTARWEEARAAGASAGTAVLVLDEIQKVTDWSAWVKRLWDEDSWAKRDIRVALTGSSPLLMQQGLSESLAGRFEVLRATHWTYPECRDAFGWDLDTFVYYGGYPGSASLIAEPERWRDYVASSIVETSVSRDILLMTRVDKPALLRRVLALACEYAGQVLTYEKMLGQLQDAGNTTTVAHYLDLLAGAGMVSGLQKYSAGAVRRRRSSPKFVVHNTALISAFDVGGGFEAVRSQPEVWGRRVEAAVGAHLTAITGADAATTLHYWRDRRGGVDFEVDHVLQTPASLVAIEVKSSHGVASTPGLAAFVAAHPRATSLVVGADGMPLEEFFGNAWVGV